MGQAQLGAANQAVPWTGQANKHSLEKAEPALSGHANSGFSMT